MEGKIMLEQLREAAGLGGPAAPLANQLLVIREQYETQILTTEEYQYLLQQISEVQAAQELANDEIAMRFIVESAQFLASQVL
jgi:hypothetical protein